MTGLPDGVGAYITRDGRTLYYYQISVTHPETGRRSRPKVRGFITPKAAAVARRRHLGELENGARVASNTDLTVGEWLTKWLPSRRTKVEANTYATLKHHVGYLAPDDDVCAAYRKRTGQDKPTLAGVKLTGRRALTGERIQAFYDDLLERGKRTGEPLAAKTVYEIGATLHKALEDACRRRIIARNPEDDADRPAVKPRTPTVWNPERTAVFLDVVVADRLFACWLLLATSAMRPSEVCGLQWPALDLDEPNITVGLTKVIRDGSTAKLVPGAKTKASAATLPLDMQTAAALRGHRKAQLAERLACRGDYGDPRYPDADLVFCEPDGTLINPGNLSKRFQTLARQAGLPDIRLYDFGRHGWATAALRAGVHPKLVTEQLRHTRSQTTMDTYTHSLPGMGEEAVAQVARLIQSHRRSAAQDA